MKSSSALSRVSQKNAENVFDSVSSEIAQNIADAWMNINACEHMLMENQGGNVICRAAPPMQNALASMAAESIQPDDRILCVGFQAYPWMAAAQTSLQDVLRVYLGKKLSEHVVSCSVEDAAKSLNHAMTIVAMHVQKPADWNAIRSISAAAVKVGTQLLVLVSADVLPPEGAAIDTFNSWAPAAVAVRDAVHAVRRQGAIRVIAVGDMDVREMERSMMEAAEMTPDAWMESIQKNNDGAESAANAAYQSPVESF